MKNDRENLSIQSLIMYNIDNNVTYSVSCKLKRQLRKPGIKC